MQASVTVDPDLSGQVTLQCLLISPRHKASNCTWEPQRPVIYRKYDGPVNIGHSYLFELGMAGFTTVSIDLSSLRKPVFIPGHHKAGNSQKI
jgi:hypothetical protein